MKAMLLLVMICVLKPVCVRAADPDVICIKEATATFCNVPTGPNNDGTQNSRASSTGTSTSSGAGANTAPSPCGEHPTNPLCY